MAAEEKAVVLAQVAERAERFDDMAEYMKQRVETGTPLNTEERDMFSAAFKQAVTERRVAVRVAVGVAAQEEAEGRGANAGLANGYKTKVEAELQAICIKALNLLESILVPAAGDAEDQTFYMKMQGDYHRYAAEFAQGEARQQHAAKADTAYINGTEAAASLASLHPFRLGLALNYSVFQHEVLQVTADAINTAQQAYATASKELEMCVDENMRSNAIQTMQLLQDNLDLWTR